MMQSTEMSDHRKDYVLQQSCGFVSVDLVSDSTLWDILPWYIDIFPYNSTFQEP